MAIKVFLSYGGADRESVEAIARKLREDPSIDVWFDQWNLVPGDPWIDELDKAIKESDCCVAFLGPSGDAPWHHEEMRAALGRAVTQKGYRLIPTLLPGTQPERLSNLPGFLWNRHWVTFSHGLDDPKALHDLVEAIHGRPPGPPKGDPGHRPPRDGKPYRGLGPFDVQDHDIFFGRDALTLELLSRLTDDTRFVSIVGPSGSGKSSLARAGLLASLQAGDKKGSERWPQIVIRPGTDPLETLAVGVTRVLHGNALDPADLIRRFGSDEAALHRLVRMALPQPDLRAVLLVDQAEEAFTQGASRLDRAAFFNNLVYAATIRTGQTVVVLAFRADFYAKFADHPQLAGLVSHNQVLVPPMAEGDLRQAIELPARNYGRPLRPALVAEMLSDAGGRIGCLPLIEHALEQLWARSEHELGIEEYRAIGGVAGALDAIAEKTFKTLDPDQQATCRRLFLRLVQQSDDVLDTRRRLRRSDLPLEQYEVSQAFAAEGVHLLTWSRENGQELLEVAHEELIRRWERLRRWVGEDRAGLRIHRRLTSAAADWTAKSRDESFLSRGAALAMVEEWLGGLPPEQRTNLLNAEEVAFLEHSRAARDRARQDQEQRAKDGLARELLGFVAANLDHHPLLNLALLRQARRLSQTEEVYSVLARWSNAAGRAELRGHLGPLAGAAFSGSGSRIITAGVDGKARIWDTASGKLLAVLAGHTAAVRSAAFSPDGLRAVTASLDRTAKVWEAAAGKLVATLSGHSDTVASAVYSRDGQRILTAGHDATARLWDAASGEPLAVLTGHSSPVSGASFSPDGLRVLTASGDQTARLWDAATGRPVAILAGHTRPLMSAAFSPDGRRIATASLDDTARVWDAATGAPIATLSEHAGPVVGAAFSHDGRRVVTSGADRTARVWEPDSGRLLATLSGHSDTVASAAFSPDGLRIATASGDHTARLYEVSTGRHLATFTGHSGPLVAAAFSPDGLRVVTSSKDRTARTWDTAVGRPTATLPGHRDSVVGLAFSADGQRVLTASLDKTARAWDVNTGKRLATFSGHGDSVQTAVFSRDGQRVLTASLDNTARLWDAATGALLSTLSGHSDWVQCAALSPDGTRAVTASMDGTARIWEPATGRSLAVLSGHTAHVVSAAFSPDGLAILTASLDGTARLWDAAAGRPLATISGHGDAVHGAAFSLDGRRAVTASIDGTARIWDVATGECLVVLTGHAGAVVSAAFSADGLCVLTASLDNTARLWEAPTGKALASLSGHTGSLVSACFSPDGTRAVTASLDFTARVWEAPSGRPLATLQGHRSSLRGGALFSPDGLRIVTASDDGTSLLWQELAWAPRRKQLEVLESGRELTPEERQTYLHE